MAGENEQANNPLFSAHEQERKQTPGAFLLTLSEAKRIMKATKIIFTLSTKYVSMGEDAVSAPEFQKQLRVEILTAFKDQRVSADTLKKICEKVKNSHYWTYSLSQIIFNANEAPTVLYTIESSEPGIGGTDAISPDTFPEYYERDHTIAEIAKILSIPDGVLYVPSGELHAAHTIYGILTADETDTESAAGVNPVALTKRQLAIQARQKAKEQGAIMAIKHLTVPSTPPFDRQLTTVKIRKLPTAEESEIIYEENESGQLIIRGSRSPSWEEAKEMHGAFLSAVLTAAIQEYTSGNHETIRLSAPAFCRDCHIEPRAWSSKRSEEYADADDYIIAIADRAKAFEQFYGEVGEDQFFRILSVDGFDPKSKVITLRSPYIFRYLSLQEAQTRKENLRHSVYNTMLHPSIVNDPNNAAFEVAQYLSNGVLRRGQSTSTNTDEGAPCKYRVKYSTLIQECPLFRSALDEVAGRPQYFNSRIKRILEAAYKMLLTESDLTREYKDFKINGVSSWDSGRRDKKTGRKIAADFNIPSKTRINDTLTITHKGRVTG